MRRYHFDRRESRATARAQTQLDFLLGATFFVLVVVLVLASVPSLLTPFVASSGATATTADSTATRLASGVLTTPDERYVLDTEAVDSFFAGDVPTARDTLGIDDETHLNVTLTGGEVDRRLGEPVPDTASTQSASWRVVSYRGSRVVLRVRVWR